VAGVGGDVGVVWNQVMSCEVVAMKFARKLPVLARLAFPTNRKIFVTGLLSLFFVLPLPLPWLPSFAS